MTELHIPTLRRIAENQLQDTGQISPELLDTIIEDWGIKFSRYNDPAEAKDLWHNLISIYLITPRLYDRACGYIEGLSAAAMAKEVWHQLIDLSLTAPEKYYKVVGYIKGMHDAEITHFEYYPGPNMENLERELDPKRYERELNEGRHKLKPDIPDIVA